MIVADAGPLTAMGRIGRLRLLRDALGKILVPEAVVEECLRDRSRPGALAIRNALRQRALIRRSASKLPLYTELLDLPGAGEAAAIALAQSLHRPVLLDEKTGRRIARKLGVPVIGTGAVLVTAKQCGLIPAVEPLLAELRESGYRLSDGLVAKIRSLSGE